ncbi:transposase [Motilimonas sp. E26]|nr:transposase [Motilimonas sp. E26]
MRRIERLHYSGAGLTARVGARLVLMLGTLFRTQHRFEQGELSEERWLRRMQRLRKSIKTWLEKGTQVPVKRYAGRCQYILKHETGLWVFLASRGTPLTNNEAERCLRGSVIMRKICYGTNSDRGDKFRSRLLSVIETSKKRGLNALKMIETIVTAVMKKGEYPDVFGLISD